MHIYIAYTIIHNHYIAKPPSAEVNRTNQKTKPGKYTVTVYLQMNLPPTAFNL